MINTSNDSGSILKVIGEKKDCLVIFDIIHYDPLQEARTRGLGIIPGITDHFVIDDFLIGENDLFINFQNPNSSMV